jgi:phosphatidylglycerophosphate synthase
VALAAIFPFCVDQPPLALGVVAVAAISDVLDGYVARRLGVATSLGAALDPITDKIFATSVMLSLVVSGRLGALDACLLSLRELLELPLLVRLLRASSEHRARAHRLKANFIGKLTTVLQFAALCAALFGSSSARWWAVATAGCGSIAAFSYWRALQRAWGTTKT